MRHSQAMVIGTRLRELRKLKNCSQLDIEARTGLLRCYVSRVENGHTIPSVATLEKWARALGLPLHELFRGVEQPPRPPKFWDNSMREDQAFGSTSKESRFLMSFRRILGKIQPRHRRLLLSLAREMARIPH